MLGKEIYTRLKREKNYYVYGVDRISNQSITAIQQFTGDLTDPEFLQSVLTDSKPDIIIHCAAIVNLKLCEDDHELTDALHLHVTEQLAKYNSPDTKIIFISTDSVFDGKKGNYSELDKPNPLNYYSMSKFLGEEIVRKNPDHLVMRTNIFGFSTPLKNSIAEWAIKSFEAGTEIQGFTDITFNAIYTKHLAQIIRELLRMDRTGTLNVASSNILSKYSFLKYFELCLIKQAWLVSASSSEQIKFEPPRPKNTTLCTSKIESILKIPTLEEGIDQLVKDYLEAKYENNKD